MNNNNKNIPKILIHELLPLKCLDVLRKEKKINVNVLSPLNDESGTANILKEYDLIILNYKNKAESISINRHGQIINYAKDGKLLIFLLHKLVGNQSGDSNYKPILGLFDNDFIFNENEKGETFDLTEAGEKSIFKDYLKNSRRRFNISIKSGYETIIESLADNVEKNSVAFRLKSYPNCYFLPYVSGNENEFCELVLQLIYKDLKYGEIVDDWVKEYSFPELENVDKNISEIQIEIDLMEVKKEKQILEKENYERIRNTLLYRGDDILTNVCKEVLNELSIDAIDGKIGREDLIFVYNKKHYMLEVKGLTKSASKKNISQLNSHAIQYTYDNEVEVKKILLINAWRELPLEERNTKDKPIFPNEIMNLVNLSNITLITTQQLFVMYCDNLEGKFDLKEFMKEIDSTKGILEGYDHIEEYKIKPVDEVESIEEDDSKNQKAE